MHWDTFLEQWPLVCWTTCLVVIVLVRIAVRRARQQNSAPPLYTRFLVTRRAATVRRAVLPEHVQAQLQRCGYIEVESTLYPLRTYHIPYRRGRIAVYEPGRSTIYLCVEPAHKHEYPADDLIVILYLLCSADEKTLLAHAMTWGIDCDF